MSDKSPEEIVNAIRKHINERGGPTLNGFWQLALDAAECIEKLKPKPDSYPPREDTPKITFLGNTIDNTGHLKISLKF